MSDALAFEAVSKRYGRSGPLALDELSCRFPDGQISGFIGPNGAGKTTAFSVVSGFLQPDSGVVRVLGEPGFDPWRLKGRLGVLPQDAELPDRHTPTELLVHLARLQGLSAKHAHGEADRTLQLVRLDDRKNARIGALSHGMRRRVAVASALLGSPELVMLDEPTAGLDPVQAHSLRQALTELRGGPTLIVSSHNLDELEKLCDWVVFVDKGRCVVEGTVAEVTGRRAVASWELGPGDVPLDALRAALPGHGLELEGTVLVHRAPADGDADAASVLIARELSAAGIAIRGVSRGQSLERAFLESAARL